MPSPKGSAVLHAKLLSDIRQIRTRLAVTIVIAEEGDDTALPCEDHVIENPSVSTLLQPSLSTVPLQVFAASVGLCGFGRIAADTQSFHYIPRERASLRNWLGRSHRIEADACDRRS